MWRWVGMLCISLCVFPAPHACVDILALVLSAKFIITLSQGHNYPIEVCCAFLPLTTSLSLPPPPFLPPPPSHLSLSPPSSHPLLLSPPSHPLPLTPSSSALPLTPPSHLSLSPPPSQPSLSSLPLTSPSHPLPHPSFHPLPLHIRVPVCSICGRHLHIFLHTSLNCLCLEGGRGGLGFLIRGG